MVACPELSLLLLHSHVTQKCKFPWTLEPDSQIILPVQQPKKQAPNVCVNSSIGDTGAPEPELKMVSIDLSEA